jgi:hypothetical protein
MRLSFQVASSSFNRAAHAAQATGSLNRRWRIIRPYRLNVVCLIVFERQGRLGVGLEGTIFYLVLLSISCSSTGIVNRRSFVDLTRCVRTINCINNIVYAAV